MEGAHLALRRLRSRHPQQVPPRKHRPLLLPLLPHHLGLRRHPLLLRRRLGKCPPLLLRGNRFLKNLRRRLALRLLPLLRRRLGGLPRGLEARLDGRDGRGRGDEGRLRRRRRPLLFLVGLTRHGGRPLLQLLLLEVLGRRRKLLLLGRRMKLLLLLVLRLQALLLLLLLLHAALYTLRPLPLHLSHQRLLPRAELPEEPLLPMLRLRGSSLVLRALLRRPLRDTHPAAPLRDHSASLRHGLPLRQLLAWRCEPRERRGGGGRVGRDGAGREDSGEWLLEQRLRLAEEVGLTRHGGRRVLRVEGL